MKTYFTLVLNFIVLLLLGQVPVIELSHPTANSGDQFGSGACINNDFAAVGAFFRNEQIGTVSIFKRENDDWLFSEELSPSDEIVGGWFGSTCAMTNETLIVGAPANSWPSDKTGQAYIFTKQGSQWVESQILTPDESYVESAFGTILSISNNYALIGAPAYDDYTGRAVVYKKNNNIWEEDVILENPYHNSQSTSYGASLSINDDWAVVGGYVFSPTPSNAGMFITIHQNIDGEWKLVQNIEIPLLHNSFFVPSNNISLQGNKLLVGGHRPYDNINEEGQGGIFVYELDDNEWTLQQDIKPSGYEDYEIGKGVSLSNNIAIIGTKKQPSFQLDNAQSILIYERTNDNDWNQILDYQLPFESSDFFSIYAGNNFGIIANSKGLSEEGSALIFDLRTYSSLQQTSSEPEIKLFPNPCHDYLKIQSSELIKSIKVFDITGQQLPIDINQNNKELNVKFWSKGIYTVQMEYKDQFVTKKIIKK